MKIAVLGSGNGGCAVAADCALNGHDVRLFDFEQFPKNIEAIATAEGIHVTGQLDGFAELSYAGHEMFAAAHEAELIYVVGPSYATEQFAEAYKSVMSPGQRVVVCPGTNGGALLFKRKLGLSFADPTITVAETSTLPYACRITKPGAVHIYLKLKSGIYLAALPATATMRVYRDVVDVYPGVSSAANTLQTILQNGNNVIHPAVSLLNAARIERPEDFLFYEEGVTAGVGRLMKAVDEERMAIANALGIDILPDPDIGVQQGYMLENNYHTGYTQAPGFKGILAQTQLDYRYLTEDVGYGLVLLTDMARVVHVPTPIMDAIIQLVSVLLDRDYSTLKLRTLESLGLGGLDKNELLKAVS